MWSLNSKHSGEGSIIFWITFDITDHSAQRVLLHTETADGSVVPVWEDVQPEGVVVLKDIMASCQPNTGVEIQYARIPITSERPPDFADISELMELVVRTDSTDSAIVVNCQLGRGRSTLTSVRYLFCRHLDSHLTPCCRLAGHHSLNSTMAQ